MESEEKLKKIGFVIIAMAERIKRAKKNNFFHLKGDHMQYIMIFSL
ncbi:MAG: hypothetical protein GF364_10330 [Candidatus Lokiarchaeota archaeon]|nr:hypothetical protein [Candidatus Lokiarchaeota archaeon]